jgi:chromosome segregation and condensation protein ScpB
LGNLASSVPSSTDNSKTKVYVSSPSFSRQFTLRESAETPKANESYAEWKARKKKAAAS